MRVNESAFFREALRFIGYGSSFGWHERNAGNISLRLSELEVTEVRDDFILSDDWIVLPEAIPEMAQEFVFTTVSGCYFIDIHENAAVKFCICEVSDDGSAYRIVWGGCRPTSEICGHLMSLAELKKRSNGRAVYHCHPANIVALSYVVPLSDKAFSEMIWESETECAFVLPEGIGVLGFFVPGSLELARATADKIRTYNAVLWSFHGIFATGDSIASAFGLAHAIEKAAEIKLKILSTGLKTINTIKSEEQQLTAETYNTHLNKFHQQ